MKKTAPLLILFFLIFSGYVRCGVFTRAAVNDLSGAEHALYVVRDGAAYSLFYVFYGEGEEALSELIFRSGGQITSPAVEIAPWGGVFAAWTAPSDGYDAVYLSRKTSSGWSGPVKASAGKPYPAISPVFYTGEGGALCLSWMGYDGNRYVPRDAEIGEDGAFTVFEREEAAPCSVPGFQQALDMNKYVGFGDSVTAGLRRQPWSGDGYKTHLQTKLRSMLNPSAAVVLRGVGGERTAVGVNRIDSVLAEERPGHILIMEGINDLQARLSYHTILFNLQEMVRKSVEFGSVPVVGLLPPRDDSVAWQWYTEEFNDYYLRPYLSEEGILMADHWKYFMETPNWRDFIDPGDQHPNAAGYDLLGEAWFVALVPLAPPSGVSGRRDSGRVVLFWAENTEYGHEGYNVYRMGGGATAFSRINEELILEPFYRDDAPPGGGGIYAVVAVDRNGNESGFSEKIRMNFSPDDGCFIATAAFGSPLADEVRILSRARDAYLINRGLAGLFVRCYYAASPAAARAAAGSPLLASVARAHIRPLVKLAGLFID